MHIYTFIGCDNVEAASLGSPSLCKISANTLETKKSPGILNNEVLSNHDISTKSTNDNSNTISNSKTSKKS